MASYRKDFDYAEAIAGTQDSAKRAELLAERQNKIDAEGLGGSVAANDAVSTWTENYRPYYASSSGGSPGGGLTVSGYYDSAAEARMKAFRAAQKRIEQNKKSTLGAIDSDYVAGMRQTDINARHSVQGNEEKLAALGLNMGGRYDAATSGAAETSRIALQNQYQGDLNDLGQAHLSARAAAENAAKDQLAALENGYYTAEADAGVAAAQAALQQYNADRSYGLSVAGLTGYLNGTKTLSAQSLQNTQSQQAYERALARWKASGYVLSSDAALLGVPAGTPTSDAAYQNANLSLQRFKAGYGG